MFASMSNRLTTTNIEGWKSKAKRHAMLIVDSSSCCCSCCCYCYCYCDCYCDCYCYCYCFCYCCCCCCCLLYLVVVVVVVIVVVLLVVAMVFVFVVSDVVPSVNFSSCGNRPLRVLAFAHLWWYDVQYTNIQQEVQSLTFMQQQWQHQWQWQ